MTLLQVAALGIRLFTLWFVVYVAGFLVITHDMSGLIPDQTAALSVGLVMSVLGLGIAAFLWVFPLAIARFLVPKIDETQSTINGHEMWGMGCVFIGLFVLSSTIPFLMTEIFLFISGGYASGEFHQAASFVIAENIFRTLFALILILGHKVLYKYAIR